MKTAYEQTQSRNPKPSSIPRGFGWDVLVGLDGNDLETHYRHTIFWLKDDALEDGANLPAPGIIAAEIVEDLKAALAQFAEIAEDLEELPED